MEIKIDCIAYIFNSEADVIEFEKRSPLPIFDRELLMIYAKEKDKKAYTFFEVKLDNRKVYNWSYDDIGYFERRGFDIVKWPSRQRTE